MKETGLIGSTGNMERSAWLSTWGVTVLFLLLAVTFFAAGLHQADRVVPEGVVCEAVCRQLLEKTTEGRQALVSSLWWPPFPFLLRLPFVFLLPQATDGVASLLVCALFGAASLILLERILRRWRVGRIRWALVAALLVNPFFLRECFSGSSVTAVIFLVLLMAANLAEWSASHTLRSLVHLGLGAAALAGLSAEMWPWILVVFLLLSVSLAVRSFSGTHREAVIITVLFPLVYAMGLWVLMNWLIMGDGFYFLRSLTVPTPEETGRGVLVELIHAMPVALSLWVLLYSAFRKQGSGLHLGAAGVAPLAIILFLSSKGLVRGAVPVLSCAFPLMLLSLGCLAGTMRGLSGRWRAPVLLAPLLLSLWAQAGTGMLLRGADDRDRYLDHTLWLPRLERHILQATRYPKVFVCGHESFRLLGARPDPMFVPALDFDFNKARQDYPGHALYLMVRRPDSTPGMDSIHWKYPDIYRMGSLTTLYDSDWGEWRLFEIIQSPKMRIVE